MSEFGNCDSTRDDGALAYRSCRMPPSTSAPGMWVYRIEGCDLGAEVQATLVSFTCVALTAEDAESQGEPSDELMGLAPAATYESGRIFFAGSKASARRLLDAFETVASESDELALALDDSDEGGSGLEAVLIEWPEGELALLTICNTNYSEERRVAVEAILKAAEARFPGAVSDMESRSDHGYTFKTHELWWDSASEKGSTPPDHVLLALHAQSEEARYEQEDYPEECEAMTRALHRREIERAASPATPGASGGKPRV